MTPSTAGIMPDRPNRRFRGTTACGIVFILLSVILAGCGRPASDPSGGPLRVVATTSMIAEAASRIGGDRVSVTGLMGPGVDPHLYKASEGDVSRMAGADLVLYHGLHLEGKMVDLFEQMASRGAPMVQVTAAIPTDSLLHSELFAGSHDPHVWFDPALWRLAVGQIRDAIMQLDPEQTEGIEARYTAYVAEIDSADAYVHRRVSELPVERRLLVTSHDAFGYFGRAYGFEVRGLQGISTASEAGTADVQQLADYVADRKLPALFIESSVSPRGIEAVMAAVRSRGHEIREGGILFGDALGSPGTPAASYPGMLRTNVDTIVEALGHE